MKNKIKLPIIYLTYANAYTGSDVFLPELQTEMRESGKVLENAIENGLCEVIIESGVRIEDIFDTFQKKGSRITLFHYAGHAGADTLILESEGEESEIAHSEGLLSFLQRQEGLECIFLNGCCSAQQTRALQQAGVPFVIGTTKEISDKTARRLAVRFYKSIGLGRTLESSWKDAESELLTLHGSNTRALYLNSENVGSQHPWEQLTLKGAELVNKWNLPAISRNYLFGLPKLASSYSPPESPFRFLERFSKSDALLYFGRNKYIRDFYYRITDGLSAPIILLTGQSGVGKSSLIEAGIIPRIEDSHKIILVRCNEQHSIIETFKQSLGIDNTAVQSIDFLPEWLQHEQDKPLVIFMDQAELIFGKSNGSHTDEIDDFLAILQNIFSSNRTNPRGKLILSYRKEYDADFEAYFSKTYLYHEKVFIEPLSAQDISEVVNGLTSSALLRRKYRFEVEDKLIPILCQDLLHDQNSAIAPTLQVILTKMWEEQLKVNRSKRLFSLEDYLELKDKGIFLKDFFETQMKELDNWAEENSNDVVKSGLAIDLLSFFTTSSGTARSLDLKEIENNYTHRNDILTKLIAELERLKLLRRMEGSLMEDAYILSHDVLAPIVQKAFEKSTYSGQQANRVLTTKTKLSNQNDNIYLDGEDLVLVEKGYWGMRSWTDQEILLINKSRERRVRIEKEQEAFAMEKKRSEEWRRKGLKVIVGLSLLLAVISGWFGISSFNQAKVNTLIRDALQQEKYDATLAYKTIQKALVISADNKAGIQARHDIYSNNEFYDATFTFRDPVVDLEVMKNGNLILVAGKTIKLLDRVGNIIWEKEQDAEVLAIDISKSQELILAVAEDGVVKVFNSKGEVLQKKNQNQYWFRQAIFLNKDEQILLGDRAGNVMLWERNTGVLKNLGKHNDEIQDLAHSSGAKNYLSISWDGRIEFMNKSNEKLNGVSIDGRGLAIAVSNDGSQIAVGDRSGAIYLLDSMGIIKSKLLAHTFRVNDVQYSPDAKMLLSASDDKTIKLWDNTGRLLRTYKGHSDFVHTVGFDFYGNTFYSGSEDQTIKRWRIESKVSSSYEPNGNEVSDLALSDDMSILVSGSGDGFQSLYSSINDLNSDFNYDIVTQGDPQDAIIWRTDEVNRNPIKLRGHKAAVTSVAIHKKNNLIITGSSDSTALFWDLAGNRKPEMIRHNSGVYDVALSDDGEWFATSGYDSLIILGKTRTLLEDTIHINCPAPVERVAFSPNGLFLLSGHSDSKVILWNLEGEERVRFSENSGSISSVAFLPKKRGSLVLVGDLKNSAILYDVNIDEYKKYSLSDRAKTGTEGVLAVDFSPRGDLIALGGISGVVEIYDLEGNQYWTIKSLDSGSVHSLAMGRDEIYVGGADEKIRRYELK